MTRYAIPLDDALPIARQIAGALEVQIVGETHLTPTAGAQQ